MNYKCKHIFKKWLKAISNSLNYLINYKNKYIFKEWLKAVGKGIIILIVLFIIFTLSFSYILDLDLGYFALRLACISSIIYNLYESKNYNKPNNMFIIILVPSIIFIFHGVSSQKYLTLESIIRIILIFNLFVTCCYMIYNNRCTKIYHPDYLASCNFPKPSWRKIGLIFLLSAFLVTFTYLHISCLKFELTLDENGSEMIPGTKKAFDIETDCNDLYPFCACPKIILNCNQTPNGVLIIFDPEKGMPNYNSRMVINVSEDVKADEYSIGIQGFWDVKVNVVFEFLKHKLESIFDISDHFEFKQVIFNLKVLPIVSLVSDLPGNSSRCTAGTTVKFTAILANNTNKSSMIYKFEKIGKYNISCNWSTNDTWLWETNQSDMGNNTIICIVNDTTRSNWTRVASFNSFIEENKPPCVKIYTLPGSYYYYGVSNDPENDTIFFKFEYKKRDEIEWKLARDWSPEPFWTKNIKLDSDKPYDVRVTVKDKHHDPDEQSWRLMNDTAFLIVKDEDDDSKDILIAVSKQPIEDPSKKALEIPKEAAPEVESSSGDVQIQDEPVHIPGVVESTETTKSFVMGFFEH